MEGTYGLITCEEIVVSNQPSVLEVSILKHLNSNHVQSQLHYNPFPTFYHVNSECIRMSNSGTSLRDSGGDCELVSYHLMDILECVSIMHSNRVVHYDLTVDNIMIDEDDRIRITNFGISSLGLAESEGQRRIIPGGDNGPAYDVWLLGASLIDLCLGEESELDLCDIHSIVDWISKHYPDLTDVYDHLIAGDLEVEIPIPDEITSPLRDHLQLMISVNPHNRPLRMRLVSPAAVNYGGAINSIVDPVITSKFTSIIDNILEVLRADVDIQCYHVTVAISILSRWFKNEGVIPDEETASRAVIDYSEAYTLLNSIKWEVFNCVNTSYVHDNAVELIDEILADRDRGKYFLFSDHQLMDKYKSLLERD